MLDIEKYKYIRLISGEIANVEKIRKLGNGMTFFTDIGIATMVGNIKAHSKNIIDLLEVGDYVNGEKITNITKNYITVGGNTFGIKNLKGIKTILTHEMYEQNCYKVGEE